MIQLVQMRTADGVDRQVRVAAQTLLCGQKAEQLEPHATDIIELLRHGLQQVRQMAMTLLAKLPLSMLAPYAGDIIEAIAAAPALEDESLRAE